MQIQVTGGRDIRVTFNNNLHVNQVVIEKFLLPLKTLSKFHTIFMTEKSS